MSLWSRLWATLFGSTPESPPHPPELGHEPARETYGVTPSDPIMCYQPAGERKYIAALRCLAGHRLIGPRRGSLQGKCPDPRHHVFPIVLPGVTAEEMCHVDCYDLVCEGGEYSCELYFDMYHPDAPPQPVPRGLTRG